MDNPVTNSAPVRAGKGLAGRFKGLPPWVYIGAVGVGVGVVWYVMHNNQAAAAATAQDQSGTNTDPGYSYSTSSGDAYPGGAIGGGASYPYDTSQTQQPLTADDFISLISTLLPTGGGTQVDTGANDHYTPPSITVNIPPSATPTPTAQAPSAPTHTTSPAPSCPTSFPKYNPAEGPVGKKSCYKCERNTTSSKNKYPWVHVYQDGHKIQTTVC